MKKFIVAVLLTLTIATTTFYGVNLNALDFNNTEVASAATIYNITDSSPTLIVHSRTSTTVSLNIGKVNGALGYKVYRASTKDGTYKYIGYTRKNSYIDTELISKNTYFYRTRAYKYEKGIKINSKYSSKIVAVPTFNFKYATKVLYLINQIRVEAGLSRLIIDDTLMYPAIVRVEETVELFSHTRPNDTLWATVLDDYNISFRTAGENLAYGYDTPEAVVEGWMNSPGHKANIMNRYYGKIGIGVYKDSERTVFCSQLFTN